MTYLKKCLSMLLICFLACTQFAQGQGYESIFGDSSSSWSFYTEAVNYRGVLNQWVYKKDTVRKNDELYYELYSSSGLASNYFLREDTSSGKVWAYSSKVETEILTMNLSLEKNDSFYLNYTSRNLDTGWHQVDTIFQKDGRKHILFEKRERGRIKRDRLVFIEGVSPTIGFLFRGRALSYQYLICNQKGDTNFYFDSTLNYSHKIDTTLKNCPETGVWYTSREKPNLNQTVAVKTNPNPAHKRMYFRINQRVSPSPFILKIFNARGLKVFNRTFQKTRFSISNPGKSNFYFYQLLSRENEILDTGKILFTP